VAWEKRDRESESYPSLVDGGKRLDREGGFDGEREKEAIVLGVCVWEKRERDEEESVDIERGGLGQTVFTFFSFTMR